MFVDGRRSFALERSFVRSRGEGCARESLAMMSDERRRAERERLERAKNTHEARAEASNVFHPPLGFNI